ncbi:hypothetical protein VCUG_02721 [Vavraia culicis subsp. floridensis]|uniref:Uncharacterized protein n=1 Tax=Vavraia culicis (isolate floridensis) TaxID=948595 RepID=L2GQX9_VAVCU|nr:uncharacterized protein VCUG_02721 [Vavraia culicis subsp. floridensis]ELA45792.1 hypothetical protein VCUG_02721 [Vavraia culicis subsp. floridensis]
MQSFQRLFSGVISSSILASCRFNQRDCIQSQLLDHRVGCESSRLYTCTSNNDSILVRQNNVKIGFDVIVNDGYAICETANVLGVVVFLLRADERNIAIED